MISASDFCHFQENWETGSEFEQICDLDPCKSISFPMRTFIYFSLFALGAGILTAAPANKANPSQRIDQLVEKQLQAKGLKPNPIASDEIFVRRIYLDIAGRIPTRAESVAFFENPAKNKRAQLVDQLLNSEAYVSHFYNYWADILRAKTQVSGAGNSRAAGYAYEAWIKNALRENRPYDVMVRELLTASGVSWENGAVGYYMRDYGMPLDNLAMTSQIFLGTQIVCAQCHDHPFDSWTQMDYYHMAAFTYGMVTTNQSRNALDARQLYAKTEKDPNTRRDFSRALNEVLKPVRFNNVWETPRKLRLPHDYQYDDAKPKSVVKPAVPWGKTPELSQAGVPIEEFATWVTASENPRFTKVISNRLWKKAMGLGLIEPVDDLREDTQASNPELMAFLERRMVNLDYDMKKFLRAIYLSKTYQREASSEEAALGGEYHFPGPILRRLSAEQIWDSLITLIVPDVDQPSPFVELDRRRVIARAEWVANGVYDLSPEEMIEIGLKVTAKQKHLADKLQGTQERVAAARETQDLEKVREALKEAALVRGELAEYVAKVAYKPGLEQKANQLLDSDIEVNDDFLTELASITVQGQGLMDPETEGGSRSNGFDGGQYINGLLEAVLAPDIEEMNRELKARNKREKEAWGVKNKKQEESYRNFAKLRRGYVRASDIRSPAPNGHFLREFGQSDRELVENANDQASITQALSLLNGSISNGTAHPWSVIRRDLGKSPKPTDRLDTIFLTMLSRPPTAEERQLLLPIIREDVALGANRVIWTLMNTRQFLFVQ